MPKNDHIPLTAADAFQELSEEMQAEAEYTIRRYLEVVKRIYDHVAAHDPKILTELRRRARLRKKLEIARI